MRIIIFSLLCSVLLIISCSPVNTAVNKTPIIEEVRTSIPKQTSTPKNIILLIGDGMGLGQISAGTFANGNTSALENFKTIGLHKPYASDKLITDSAAAATAFACGIKTYNGAIAVDENKNAVPTILEEAESYGKATGLIATSSIVHATPACFIAHNEYRKNYEEIATDFLKTEIDFFVGGGLKHFYRRDSDDRNLIKELQGKGYVISDYFQDDLEDLSPQSDQNFGYLTADEEPIPTAQGRDYLPTAASMSYPFLKEHSDKGFFLMIEGSQIDWGGHANNTNYIITEFLEFDKVIQSAFDFAKADGNTLVIVTADHETGGFAIQKESKMDSIVGAFTSDYHTGTMIPVFAYGPGEELFQGIYENIEIYSKMRQAFSWTGSFSNSDQ